MRNRIITVLFICCIAIVGTASAIKMIPKTAPSVKAAEYSEISKTIDAGLVRNMAGRYSWIDMNGLFQKSIGKTFVEDKEADVYRMNNGQLIYSVDKMATEEIVWYADNLDYFNEELKEAGIPMIYVQLPFKIRIGDNMMPVGSSEYANSNATSLVATYNNEYVDVLDLRDSMNELGDDHYSLFYNTDQHWTNTTALWAAGKIAEHAHQTAGLSYDAEKFKLDNFNVTTYKKHFLGSFGKKAGKLYGGVDDYDLVLPRFATSFNFTADTENGKIERKGPFEDALLDKTNLEKNLFEKNTYETYTGGNYAFTSVRNNKNPDGSKVLLIRDSFSCSMMPFLSLAYKELDAIDLRYYDKISALELARSGKYDAVIVAYNPTVFGEKAFTFCD